MPAIPDPKRMAFEMEQQQKPWAKPRQDSFNLLCEDDKYLLQRRHIWTYGGRDIRKLLQSGNEIENWRPDVAFPLDLGTVDLHAVTMSLASRDPGDVRQALDKLVVVTADARVHISLQHCPRLFANLSAVITDVLQTILEKPSKKVKSIHTKIGFKKTYPNYSASVGDRLLEKMKEKKGGEDLLIEVDSATGAELNQDHSENESFSEIIEEVKTQKKPEKEQHQSNGTKKKSDPHVPLVPTQRVEDNGKPFNFVDYTKRYERVEREFQKLEETEDEQAAFFRTAACNRLLAGTCILRNMSFAEPNKPLIAKKPEFLKLLWSLLFSLAENECLLDSDLLTLDLCKDLLVLLSNIALHLVLDDPKNVLVLILFLLSFSMQTTPYLEDGTIEFIECDTEVHRYVSNAVDVFAKITPRDSAHLNLVEGVLRDTITDPEYRILIKRYLGKRSHLEPCEFMTRMFAMNVSVLPYPHFKLTLDSRGQVIWQASMCCEMLANMIPSDDQQPEDAPTPWKGYNVAAHWLNSLDRFGIRILRTIKFMGMVTVPAGEDSNEKTRPFAGVTQRAVRIMRILYQKARQSADFSKAGIFPTVEQVLGGLFASEMDKSVVRHLEYFYIEGQNHV